MDHNKLDRCVTCSRQRHREVTNYNGTLIFRIDNYMDRYLKARDDINECLYSEPFYTSLDGYKMRLRVFLNGTGRYRGTYMSVFLDVDKKTIPFNGRVEVRLLNQMNDDRYCMQAFNINQNETNVTNGIETFAILTKVQNERCEYLYRDSIVIKVIVKLL